MSEMLEGPKAPRNRLSLKWPLRLIAIFAGATMIGFGCCGWNAHLVRHIPVRPHAEFPPTTAWGLAGAGIISLSAMGLAGSVLALVIVRVANAFRKE